MIRKLFAVFAVLAVTAVAACGGDDDSGGDDAGGDDSVVDSGVDDSAVDSGGGDSAGGDADGPETISVTVSNPTEVYGIPWLVGREQGLFEDRGVVIDEIVPGAGGSTTLRNLLSGDLEFADVGYTAVVEGTAAGVEVTVVGGAMQSPYGLDFYALASNDAVNEIADIETWAYTNPGSVTQAMTLLLPEAAGVTTESESVAAGGVGEGIALLEAGDVDVAVVPTSVVSQNPDKFKLVVAAADLLGPFQQSVIATSAGYAESNPDVTEAVLAGYADAVQWITDNPADAGALYAASIDIPADVATQVVEDAIAADAWGVGFNAEALTAAADAIGLAGEEVDVDYCTVFDPSFLPEGASTELPVAC